ncbi:hypothetical protein [Natrinema amylolyticum]|uniref:hypothetical protein n=1 Tax=Natrinema amylolyticum TaxID=2878679 RepID=UPI001CFA1FCE|nr:hypothetical protein [Natrinema amylolyticum]
MSVSDSNVEILCLEVAAECFPILPVADVVDGDYTALVDTMTAETLFNWVPEWAGGN